MVNNHYRWDFIGLSTDEKPTPETSEKVVDGSTFYCSDNSKLYVFCQGEWYEKVVEGGGGGSDINVVQTTGESTTDVMSQKAVTDALASAGGGGATELTSADYNYPTNNPNGIAHWLLDSGVYKIGGSSNVNIYYSSSGGGNKAPETMLIVNHNSSFSNVMIGETGVWSNYAVQTSNGSSYAAATGELMSTGKIKQTTGTSTTDVMSQDATSKMIYVDPANATSGIAIGKESPQATSSRAIAIGNNSRANSANSIALGYYARPTHGNSVAIGAGAVTTDTNQVSIQKVSSGYGYNNTVYTLLSGLYDPQNDHDAANKQYVDSLIAALEARIAALEGN